MLSKPPGSQDAITRSCKGLIRVLQSSAFVLLVFSLPGYAPILPL